MYATISAASASRSSDATFGIAWTLDKGPYTADQLAEIPAKVRVTGSYMMSEQGEHASAFALIGAEGTGVLADICSSAVNPTDGVFHPFDIEATTTRDGGIPLTAANLASPIVVVANDHMLIPVSYGGSITVKIDSITVTLSPPPQQPTTTTLTVPTGATGGQTIDITSTVTTTDGDSVTGGAVVPNAVELLRQRPDQVYPGHWKMVDLNADGTFATTNTMTEAGTVQYTALFVGTTGFASSYGPTKWVTVTPTGLGENGRDRDR